VPVPNVAERTPAMLVLPRLLGAFQPPSPHRARCLGAAAGAVVREEFSRLLSTEMASVARLRYSHL
jgi:hypothetical protein